MTELWWPEARRDALCPTSLSWVPGTPKGLLHTTEGFTIASAVAAYRAKNSWPHVTLSFEGGTFSASEHIPISLAARSLVHTPGAPETNRAHVIQAEIVWHAADAATMPHAFLDGIARWMRWVEANAGVQRMSSVAWKAYPGSYGAVNGVRLSPGAWAAYGGWCGHMHAPQNLHGDPGLIDIAYLLGTTPTPDPTPGDDMTPNQAADLTAIKNYVVENNARLIAAQSRIEDLESKVAALLNRP